MITRGAIAIILFSECTLNELESQFEGEIMISRRDLSGVTAVLTSVRWLHGQNASPVVVSLVVTDRYGRYVNGLKLSDFRVFEDAIPQTISTFVGSRPKPPDPRVPPNDAADNSYTVTYYPDPSNHNDGFRVIRIEIVTDVDKKWRVRSRPGYRPEKRPVP